MPDKHKVCAVSAPLTLGQFREYTSLMSDDALIVPRFVNAPGDHEPGVRLLGVGNGDELDEEPVVSLAVELFYLDHEEEDEEDVD